VRAHSTAEAASSARPAKAGSSGGKASAASTKARTTAEVEVIQDDDTESSYSQKLGSEQSDIEFEEQEEESPREEDPVEEAEPEAPSERRAASKLRTRSVIRAGSVRLQGAAHSASGTRDDSKRRKYEAYLERRKEKKREYKKRKRSDKRTQQAIANKSAASKSKGKGRGNDTGDQFLGKGKGNKQQQAKKEQRKHEHKDRDEGQRRHSGRKTAAEPSRRASEPQRAPRRGEHKHSDEGSGSASPVRRRGPPSGRATALPASPSGSPARRREEHARGGARTARSDDSEKVDPAKDRDWYEAANELYVVQEISDKSKGGIGVFDWQHRPSTDGRKCAKKDRDQLWHARSCAGWLRIPHPGKKGKLKATFAGIPIPWASEGEWSAVSRRLVVPLRHQEPPSMLADGSVELQVLADLLRAEPGEVLEAALFSFDEARGCFRYEVVAALAPSAGARHPQLWIRAVRKHSIEIAGAD
jgi:hypothetical protein